MSKEVKYATISVYPETHRQLKNAKMVKSANDLYDYNWSEFLEYLLELHEKQEPSFKPIPIPKRDQRKKREEEKQSE